MHSKGKEGNGREGNEVKKREWQAVCTAAMLTKGKEKGRHHPGRRGAGRIGLDGKGRER